MTDRTDAERAFRMARQEAEGESLENLECAADILARTRAATRTTEEIMHDIVQADVWPRVFRVSVVASDYKDGFDAVMELRGSAEGGYPGMSYYAGTISEALLGAERLLVACHGRCPKCGQHRNTEP